MSWLKLSASKTKLFFFQNTLTHFCEIFWLSHFGICSWTFVRYLRYVRCSFDTCTIIYCNLDYYWYLARSIPMPYAGRSIKFKAMHESGCYSITTALEWKIWINVWFDSGCLWYTQTHMKCIFNALIPRIIQ